MANIVCFDDDDKTGSYATSPASSVSSPWSKTNKSKLDASVVVNASATTLKTTSGFKLPPESVPVTSTDNILNSSEIESDVTCLGSESAAVVENTETLYSFTKSSIDVEKSKSEQSEGLIETTPENSIGPNEQLDEVMKSFSNILDTYPLHSPTDSPVSTEAPPGDQGSDLVPPSVEQTVLSSNENGHSADKKQVEVTDGSSSERMRSDSVRIMQSESATSLPSVGTSVTSTASESR